MKHLEQGRGAASPEFGKNSKGEGWQDAAWSSGNTNSKKCLEAKWVSDLG